MEKSIDELNQKIISTINDMPIKELECKIFNPYHDFGDVKCFAVAAPRDEVAGVLMVAVDGYVEDASWQDDYGGLHTTYTMKHDSSYTLGFDVGYTGANGELLKKQGIDPKVYRTTVMYIPPSQKKEK